MFLQINLCIASGFEKFKRVAILKDIEREVPSVIFEHPGPLTP